MIFSEKQQAMLQQCINHGVTHDDLGYILKDAYNSALNDSDFYVKIRERCETNFFDTPKKILRLLNSVFPYDLAA